MRPTLRFLRRPAALAFLAAACTADRLGMPSAPDMASPLLSVAAASSSVAPLVITEVMANPAETNDIGEWIEVFNAGYTDVDLKDYRLESVTSAGAPEADHKIASSVIVPAGGCVVLANTPAITGVPVAYRYTGIPLANSTTLDLVRLLNNNGALVDVVAYSGNGQTYNANAHNGVSRYLEVPSGTDITALDNSVMAASPPWHEATAQYNTINKGSPGTCPYNQSVEGGEVARVTVTSPSGTLVIGRTMQLSATGRDEFGRVSSATFKWSTSNDRIAAVDEATGIALGVAEGVATITATAANGVSGYIELTVQAPAPATIALNVNFPDTLPVGYTKPVFATVRDASGTIITPTPVLVWSSGNLGVLTVEAPGYIQAVAVGRTTVTATAANGVSGSLRDPFTVIPADAPTSAVYRDHVAFGKPTDADASDDHLIARRQFSSSYNARRGGPNWVSWNINATQFGAARRCDCFTADVTLPEGFYRVVDFDYRNGGFDRGHMVQSESRTTTNQENAATFLLTNILPQAAENNQGPWLTLENHLNDLARDDGKEIYVIAGGIYAANPSTLKNEDKVAIPQWTWKVAVVMAGGRGRADVQSVADLEVIAIKIPNEASPGVPITGIRTTTWETYKTTVDELEALTGYDLLALLPDEIELIVESEALQRVQTVTASVDRLVENGTVSKGSGNALRVKLDAATKQLERGGIRPALGQLGSFIHEVDALERSGRLATTDADALRTPIAHIVQALSE